MERFPESSSAARVLLGGDTTEYPVINRIDEYRIVRRLGAGGMGVVYEGVHERLGVRRAIKTLRPGLDQDGKALNRFEREIQALGSLRHANITEPHDARMWAGMPILVMELVEGIDTETLVRECGGRLGLELSCEIIRQSALGLAEVHRRGVLHRDIKPSNLIVDSSGLVKVTDLGLAKIFSEQEGVDGVTVTDSGIIAGTPSYISPEAAEGKELGPESDLYSLGCTAYRLLAGEPPFPSKRYKTPIMQLQAHREESPKNLIDIVPELPREVSDLVMRMLSKDVEGRPGSSLEVTLHDKN